MGIGVVNGLKHERENGIFEHVKQFGLTTCQLVNWKPDLWTEALAAKVSEQARTSGVRPCALWTGYSGPACWNFTEGPTTLGLVPPEFREQRILDLKKGADFAAKIGVPAIVTHCGFIPENMSDPLYEGVLQAI